MSLTWMSAGHMLWTHRILVQVVLRPLFQALQKLLGHHEQPGDVRVQRGGLALAGSNGGFRTHWSPRLAVASRPAGYWCRTSVVRRSIADRVLKRGKRFARRVGYGNGRRAAGRYGIGDCWTRHAATSTLADADADAKRRGGGGPAANARRVLAGGEDSCKMTTKVMLNHAALGGHVQSSLQSGPDHVSVS